MTHFDPYQSWLGIPPHEQPPTHYRLLGIPLFESNPHVISHAAERQAHHIQNFLGGPYTDACYRILAELAAAQQCLLDPQQKAYYDHQLEQMLANRSERVVTAAPPPPPSMPMPGPAYPQAMHQGPVGGYPMAGPPMPQAVPMPPTMPMASGYPMPAAMPAPAPVPAYPAQPAAVAPRPIAATAPRTAPAPAPAGAPAGNSAAASPPPVGPPAPSPLAAVLADETPAKRSLRRLRKREKGLSKEAMAAGSILGVIALLAAIWIAVQSSSRERHGWDQLTPDGSENRPAKFVPKSDKEREKEEAAKSKSADRGKSKPADDGKVKSELPKLQPKAVPPADLRPKDRSRSSGDRRDRRPKFEEPPVAPAVGESPPHEVPRPATLSPKEKRKAERENLLPPLPEEIEN